MQANAALKTVGLSENEAKVYQALLSLGSSKAGRVSKVAELDRTSTYNSLKSLLEKGLASYVTIGKVKWFAASNPQNLKAFLTDKLERLEDVLPALEKEFGARSGARWFYVLVADPGLPLAL